MSLTEMVIMPGVDYQNTCDAIREKTGGTNLIKSGDMSPAILGMNTFIQPEDNVLDPDEIYRTTRPSGWLPLPVPDDTEIYQLGLIPKGLNGYFAAAITFTGSCVVEFGNLVNGVFVAKESITPTSATRFSHKLSYEDYGDELPDGRRQYIVRISGNKITSYDGRRISLSIPSVLIVDAVCGIPMTDGFQVGDINGYRRSLRALRYLRFVGKGKPGSMTARFTQGCTSLRSVSCEAENDGAYVNYCCYQCQSLIAISPNLFMGDFKNATYMFYESGLQFVRLSVRPTNSGYMFALSRLNRFDKDVCDTQNITTMSNMFFNCFDLQEVADLDISALTTTTNMFNGCYELARLVFAGDTTPGGFTINLTQTSLGHDALLEMIDSLPMATTAATITVTGIVGASELTDEEIAVATAKNWTITV